MPGTYPTPYATAQRRRRANRERKWALHVRPRLLRDEFAEHVERMTNRQRSRWGRAGYPGVQARDVEPLWAFVPPPRDTVKLPSTTGQEICCRA